MNSNSTTTDNNAQNTGLFGGTLIFYATSPAHATALRELRKAMPSWNFIVLCPANIRKISPGTADAFSKHGFLEVPVSEIELLSSLHLEPPCVLAFGAIFERFALRVFAWAKERHMAIVAFEEVAQLALNDSALNNYDAPFDRLFLASKRERELFLRLGYPPDMLKVSGLLAHNSPGPFVGKSAAKKRLGLSPERPVIVYTTSPLRHRLAIHNADDVEMRRHILQAVGKAAKQLGAQLVVKLHPNEDLGREKRRILRTVHSAKVIGRDTPIELVISAADVLINRGNSQTALDSALRLVPTVIAGLGRPCLFQSSGAAWVADSLDQLTKSIVSAAGSDGLDVTSLRDTHSYCPPQGTAQLIASEIRLLAEQSTESNGELWKWLLKSTLFMGSLEDALALCKRLDGQSTWIGILHSALESHFAGRTAESLVQWEMLEKIDPEWFFPKYELAHKYRDLGEYAVATRKVGEAIARHPEFHCLWHEVPMRRLSAFCYEKLGLYDAAMEQRAELVKKGLDRVLPDLMIDLAEGALEHGDTRNADNLLRAALKSIKEFPFVTDQKVDGELFKRIGRLYYDRRQRLKGLFCYRKAFEMGVEVPFWSRFSRILARYLSSHGKFVGI